MRSSSSVALHRPRRRRDATSCAASAVERVRARPERRSIGQRLAARQRAAAAAPGRDRRARATTCRCPTARAPPGSGVALSFSTQPLDVGVAAEEELGVLLVEDLEAAVRADVVAAARPARSGPSGMPLIALTSAWSARESSMPPRKSTHVRVRRKGGSVVGSNGSAQPGQEDREQPEAVILGRAVQRARASSSCAQAPRSLRPMKTAQARDARRAVGKLLLPAPARRQVPLVEPRLETRAR